MLLSVSACDVVATTTKAIKWRCLATGNKNTVANVEILLNLKNSGFLKREVLSSMVQ